MSYNPYLFSTSEAITASKINSLRAFGVSDVNLSTSANIDWAKLNKSSALINDFADFPSPIGNTGKFLTTDGNILSWQTITNISDLFYKTDSTTVAFEKTGIGTAQIKAGTVVDVEGTEVSFSTETSIAMPTLVAGTDYAIWVSASGAIQATANHTSPPSTSSWRKIGGFHYAPGGNATAQSGGNTTPQINEHSFWDLKFRPACPDPRGMTLVANTFWADIYLTGVDAIINGSSKYNVAIADGVSPPKVPVMYGGDNSITYGSYKWFEAMELATAFGKKCPTQQEFMALAYGTTEASSNGSDPVSTTLIAARTSKWGCVQSTGVLWVWARDRGGPFGAASWNVNTEGRGSEYNAPNACMFGGSWVDTSNSGSRCSNWSDSVSQSFSSIGSRFVCDHLRLD